MQTIRVACCLILPILLAIAMPASAQRPYEPPLTLERAVTKFVVAADGSHTQTMEYALRINTPQAVESEGTQQISYVSSQEVIHKVEAWTLQPDGTRVPVLPGAIRDREEDNSGGNASFSDTKVKVLIFPQVQVGSVLSYRAESTIHTPPYPGEFAQSYYLSGSVPFRHFEVRITLPATRKLHVEMRGVTGGLQESADGLAHYVFRYQREDSAEPEPGAAGSIHHEDYLRVSTMPDMLALGRIAHTFFAPKVALTPEIRTLAAELTAGLADERAKVRALYLWVARNIRYVAMSLGDGRLVPRPAGAVLGNRYGDCKDHVVLLEALMAAAGIASSPALVNAGSSYAFAGIGIHDPINHVITYVPSLDLYLDATDRFAPFGTLPYSVLDKPVVLTALGRFGRTPRIQADEHFTRTRLRMTIGPDGAVTGRSHTVFGGVAEIASRRTRFDNRSEAEEAVVKDLLFRFNETGTGSMSHPEPEDIGQPYHVEAMFLLDPAANLPGRGAIIVPTGLAPGEIAGAGSVRPPAKRVQPYRCRSSLAEERYVIDFPKNVVIDGVPRGVNYRNGAIEYRSRYERTGRQLKVERVLRVQHAGALCGPREHAEQQAFFKVLQRDLRSQVFYR